MDNVDNSYLVLMSVYLKEKAEYLGLKALQRKHIEWPLPECEMA